MTASPLEAVIFDFDGTLVDSEMPIYRAYAAALEEMGHQLTVAGWATVVGHGEDDSHRALCQAVGADLDRAELEARYSRQDRSWRDTLPPIDGARRLIADLLGAGVALGVASSSPSSWVESHLRRLGLRDRFSVVASCDDVGGRTKPDPASYRYAMEHLHAVAARTIAIEDSGPGIAAALAAGLHVVAIPSEITRHANLTAASSTVGSMAELTVEALAEMLAGS